MAEEFIPIIRTNKKARVSLHQKMLISREKQILVETLDQLALLIMASPR